VRSRRAIAYSNSSTPSNPTLMMPVEEFGHIPSWKEFLMTRLGYVRGVKTKLLLANDAKETSVSRTEGSTLRAQSSYGKIGT